MFIAGAGKLTGSIKINLLDPLKRLVHRVGNRMTTDCLLIIRAWVAIVFLSFSKALDSWSPSLFSKNKPYIAGICTNNYYIIQENLDLRLDWIALLVVQAFTPDMTKPLSFNGFRTVFGVGDGIRTHACMDHNHVS